MSKIFVYGTARGDAKGKDDERGTVAVKAATIHEANAVFLKAKGPKDPRIGVVRLPRANEHVDEVIHAPEVKTERMGNAQTRIDVGPVEVHELPEPKADTAGDVAQVFADLDADAAAGTTPKKKARSSTKAARSPSKRGKRSKPAPAAES